MINNVWDYSEKYQLFIEKDPAPLMLVELWKILFVRILRMEKKPMLGVRKSKNFNRRIEINQKYFFLSLEHLFCKCWLRSDNWIRAMLIQKELSELRSVSLRYKTDRPAFMSESFFHKLSLLLFDTQKIIRNKNFQDIFREKNHMLKVTIFNFHVFLHTFCSKSHLSFSLAWFRPKTAGCVTGCPPRTVDQARSQPQRSEDEWEKKTP
jgi:hypothetical protein